MKLKKIIFFLALLLFPLNVFAKVNVVATLPVFASIAEEIGGERVSVVSLARGNQDPHYLDAKPSYVVSLNSADILIHGGLDLEVGWLPPILVQARNTRILPNNPGNVNAAQGLNILEVPKTLVDRSMGDVHTLGNPHVWLDPRNIKVTAANIYQHLAQADPEGKTYYEQRLKDFINRLNSKINEWENATQNFKNLKVISYHRSFSYFAAWTGLQVANTIESKPGIPPDSKHVEDLIQSIPTQKISVILLEGFYPKKIPEYISQTAHISMILAPTDVGQMGIKNYFDLMDHLISEIKKAAS